MASKRTEEMTSFIVMDVLERANEMERQGYEIIPLNIGNPAALLATHMIMLGNITIETFLASTNLNLFGQPLFIQPFKIAVDRCQTHTRQPSANLRIQLISSRMGLNRS